MTRPKYRIIIQKNNEELTVQEIALVDEPAVEINFLYFNKDKKPLYFNDDKMLVAGPLMVPDKLIFRYDEQWGEYDVFFSKEDVENARYNFKKFGLTGEFNREHSSEKLDVVLIEDFIVEENDIRTEKYGFKDLPVGTWFGISKVEDFETWERIKKGELRGYSVEGLFQLKQEFKKTKENFVIEPNPGESKDDFIGRCIAGEIGAGYDEDQAAGICYAKWEDMGLTNLYKLLEDENFGTKRNDNDKWEAYELTEENYMKFAVEWDFPDWMKPKDTGEGEIKTPSNAAVNKQAEEQERTIPVYYFYDKRPGAQFSGAGIIDEKSRDFCIRLVSQNKYFTKEQINQMTLTAGFDVFQYAGGKNCRHNWFIAIPIIEEFEKINNNSDVDISTIKNKNSKMKKTIKTYQKFVIETELENGTEVIVNADELAVGAEVNVKVAEEGDVAETDMFQPAPDGSHTLADGTIIVTEGGLITEITESTPEETTEEVEAGKKKEKMEITEEDLVVIMEALAPKFEEIMGMIAELSSKVNSTEETSEEELTSEENFNKAKTGLSAIEKLMVVKQKFNLK